VSVSVHVTPLARDDFDGLRDGLGEEFVDEVLATLVRVGEMPQGYGEIGEGIRAVGLRRFGFVVYYRSDGANAEVVAVLHGARSPAIWRSRA